MNFEEFITTALNEDIREGDHSTLCCIAPDQKGMAVLKIKEDTVLAGVQVAQQIAEKVEPGSVMKIMKHDADQCKSGELAFQWEAGVHAILKTERLMLNIMQRMSGIASATQLYVDKVKGYPCKILDTRKTTPNFRWFEKEAVRIGGGHNHRMGLYDMIMLKDNHIDYCGSIELAIDKANHYLQQKNLSLAIEVETRSIEDVKRVMAKGGVQRIMFDNFSPRDMKEAVDIVNKEFETEASGGITLENILAYAETGVDFISVGALTHHAVSKDLSLKAIIV